MFIAKKEKKSMPGILINFLLDKTFVLFFLNGEKNIIYGKDSEERIKRECSWVFYKIRYEYYSINFVCLVVLIVENLGKMTKLII